MLKRELAKGSIAKFMDGHAEPSSPTLVQVIDLKEDKNTNPPTTILVYFFNSPRRLSDGVSSCRAIVKTEDAEAVSRVRIFDVIDLELRDLVYANGLYSLLAEHRAIILDKPPKVAYSGISTMIGMPEDYSTMVFRMALKNKTKVGAVIPLTGMSLQEMQAIISTAKADDYVITPLSSLTKHSFNWTAKVRITKKYGMRSCKGGTGTMQKMDLVDRDSTEMPMLLFDEAIAAAGDSLREGSVYFVSNGKVKEAMGQTKGANNKLTIFADKHTKIEPATEDNSIPRTV